MVFLLKQMQKDVGSIRWRSFRTFHIVMLYHIARYVLIYLTLYWLRMASHFSSDAYVSKIVSSKLLK